MKTLKYWIIAAIAAALTLSTIAGVSAQGSPPPTIPAFFVGTVTAPEGPVAVGLPVVAEIGGADCTNTGQTLRQGSTIRYAAVVTGGGSCGTEGAVVRFKIGDRYATPTGTWSTDPPRQTLNLTLEALPPPEPETVTIDVTAWRSMRFTDRYYVSTRPEGQGWTTHNIRIDLTTEHATHPFWVGSPVPVEVSLGDGRTLKLDVTLWRSMRFTDRYYVSTRPEGQGWTTHNTRIDLTTEHATHPFWVGSPVPVEITLDQE